MSENLSQNNPIPEAIQGDLLQNKVAQIVVESETAGYGPLETADWILETVTLALNQHGIDCRELHLAELEAVA